ncbi:MAG: DUF2207 domain-containing protein [Acidobacteria bacterium]|nr:DUF2207 domain-containing protein [Acidobacteriota bacterium]
MRRALRLIVFFLLAGMPAAPVAAKDYSAVRFDSTVRVQRDGKLEVTETIAFRFEGGTFQQVVREIPLRRTDSIEVVRAEMDGTHLRFGDGVGQAEVTRKSRITVRWRFAPVSDSTHTFLLTYVVIGAVRKERGADVLVWRATPGEHPYAIEAAAIEFQLPVPAAASPALDLRRVGSSEVQNDGTNVRITARDIRPDGWIEATFRFAEGTIVASAPEWQQRQLRQAAIGPRWLMAGAGIVLLGLIVLFGMRQSYDAPPPDESARHEDADGPHLMRPDTLAPPVAGAIVANGKPALEHAMAVVFSLADRGELGIDEQPRSAFRQRTFAITRQSTTRPLAAYEQAVLEAIFPPDSPAVITLSKARTQLMRRFRTFSVEITRELIAAGLLDECRSAVRRRYQFTGVALMIAGAISVIPMAFLVEAHGGWPMAVPAALIVTGLAAFIFMSATTPLSNDGVRRAHHWRAYQTSLKAIARNHAEAPTGPDVLPLAVAFGLAAVWSQYLKQRHAAAPSWFRALTVSADDGMAFPAFLASGGAGSTGAEGSTGGASSGSAAGGGSSSAN